MVRVEPTRFKLCGMTRLEDARHGAEVGAWALGMVFAPASPRACDPAEAQRIGAALRRQVELAGVFVNAPLDEVEELAALIPLSLVQLHGDEGPAYCAEIARRTGARVIKAQALRTGADVRHLDSFHTDFHLADAHVPGVPGGTGTAFDHGLLRARRSDVRLIVAGGLTPENVAEAITVAKPFAVDVASGIESAPGVKDPVLVDAFAAAVAATAPAPVADPEPSQT